MVSSQEEEVLRVLNFVSKEKADGFQGLFASVHIVTKEQVVGLGRKTPILKETKQIRILTMYVSCGGEKYLRVHIHICKNTPIYTGLHIFRFKKGI